MQVVFTFQIHPFIPVFIGGDSINVRQYRRGNLKWTIQRNWLHRITKTQDEDKQNTKTKHNMCWTPPYTRRRQTKQKTQHNMCWTPPYTRRRQTKQKTQHNMCWTPPYTRHKTKTSKIQKHSTLCVGHHHTQDTRRRQTKQKTQHNMCWTPPYTRHKTKTN